MSINRNIEGMEYSFKKHRFVLTKQGLLDELGINLDVDLNLDGSSNSATTALAFLDTISNQVYSYLYRFNEAQKIQWIIAECASAKEILKDAMQQQTIYVLTVGDLSRSTDIAKRKLAIDEQCKGHLDREVRETNCTLTFAGFYPFVPPPYAEGEY